MLLATVGNLSFITGERWKQLLAAATAFLVLRWFIQLLQGPSTVKRPPCLPSIPIVGSLPFMRNVKSGLVGCLAEQAAKYGDIFALYFASRYVVVLNGRDVITEALVKNAAAFADRPQFFLPYNYVNPRDKGMFMARYDTAFRRKHQLYLSILKEFGVGQRSIETRINVSVAELIDLMREKNGQPFNPKHIIHSCVANVIGGILFGRRYSFGDPTIERLNALHWESVKDRVPEAGMWPALRFLPSVCRRIRASLSALSAMVKALDEEVNAILSKSGSERDDCFVKRFVQLTAANGSSTSSKKDDFDREELLFSLKDLYGGGRETVADTIEWALIELANHPDEQSRMRKEVDDVIGTDRLPSLDDESKMPYTQAVVLETLRQHPVAPLALFHSTVCDTHVGEYFIPKDAMVIVNLYNAHMNATTWNDYTAFRPQRFLDECGHVTGKHRVIPFSLGRRSCLGEFLARHELFLFLAAIVQNFNILPPEGQEKILSGMKEEVVTAPMPFQLRLTARHRQCV